MKLLQVLMGVFVLWGCESKPHKQQNPSSQKVVPVIAEPIQSKILPLTFEVISVLTGQKQADVYSRVSGKISHLGPSEGQRIKQGDVLFRVDRSDPGESFLTTPVVSPISGWIGRWLITSLGAPVSAQDVVVTVVDDTVLRASVKLPTEVWLLVNNQTPVKVQVGEKTKAGSVVGISRSAEPGSSRGVVTVETDNANNSWKSGMVAKLSFEVEPKPRILIPMKAVMITNQGSFIYLVKDGKAKRTEISYRLFDNDYVEGLQGIESGDTLVVEGVYQLADDIDVRMMSSSQGDKP